MNFTIFEELNLSDFQVGFIKLSHDEIWFVTCYVHPLYV